MCPSETKFFKSFGWGFFMVLLCKHCGSSVLILVSRFSFCHCVYEEYRCESCGNSSGFKIVDGEVMNPCVL